MALCVLQNIANAIEIAVSSIVVMRGNARVIVHVCSCLCLAEFVPNPAPRRPAIKALLPLQMARSTGNRGVFDPALAQPTITIEEYQGRACDDWFA